MLPSIKKNGCPFCVVPKLQRTGIQLKDASPANNYD